MKLKEGKMNFYKIKFYGNSQPSPGTSQNRFNYVKLARYTRTGTRLSKFASFIFHLFGALKIYYIRNGQLKKESIQEKHTCHFTLQE